MHNSACSKDGGMRRPAASRVWKRKGRGFSSTDSRKEHSPTHTLISALSKTVIDP